MHKIILKTDNEATNRVLLHELVEDVRLIRDVLQTVSRQYHLVGKTGFDELIEEVAHSKSYVDNKVIEMVKALEVVKNEQALFESKGNQLESKVKLAELAAARLGTKMTKFTDDVNATTSEIEEDYKFIVAALGGDIKGEHMNVPALAVTVANLTKRLERLEKRKSLWSRFLNMFK